MRTFRNKNKKIKKTRRNKRRRGGAAAPDAGLAASFTTSSAVPQKDCEYIAEHWGKKLFHDVLRDVNLDMLYDIYRNITGDTSLAIYTVGGFHADVTRYNHAIVYKDMGDRGHYVYVTPNRMRPTPIIVYGTYENKVLCGEDDGVCMIYALLSAVKINFPSATYEYFTVKNYARDEQRYQTLVFDFARGPAISETDSRAIIINYYLIYSFLYYILAVNYTKRTDTGEKIRDTDVNLWNKLRTRHFGERRNTRREEAIGLIDNWMMRATPILIAEGVIREIPTANWLTKLTGPPLPDDAPGMTNA